MQAARRIPSGLVDRGTQIATYRWSLGSRRSHCCSDLLRIRGSLPGHLRRRRMDWTQTAVTSPGRPCTYIKKLSFVSITVFMKEIDGHEKASYIDYAWSKGSKEGSTSRQWTKYLRLLKICISCSNVGLGLTCSFSIAYYK